MSRFLGARLRANCDQVGVQASMCGNRLSWIASIATYFFMARRTISILPQRLNGFRCRAGLVNRAIRRAGRECLMLAILVPGDVQVAAALSVRDHARRFFRANPQKCPLSAIPPPLRY